MVPSLYFFDVRRFEMPIVFGRIDYGIGLFVTCYSRSVQAPKITIAA
jgi:hypothetical protein